MTANPTLVKMRGIDEESVKQINLLHEKLDKLDKLMSRASLGVFQLDVYQRIETIEYALQNLWKFDTDPSMHTYKYLYKFRSQWTGRRFQCKTTGEVFTIPEDVKERDCYWFGKAMVDVGRLDAYARFSNVIEITNQNGTVD